MALSQSVRSADRWTITPVGREDLEKCDTCACRVKIVGLIVECQDCGTVYGNLREEANQRTSVVPKFA